MNRYELGIEFYERKIEEAKAKINDGLSDQELILLKEDIETYTLKRDQSVRRSRFFIDHNKQHE